MTFTPNIPTSGQSLNDSRDLIKNNFNVINTAFSVNHIAFNDTGEGKHKWVTLPEQGTAPATLANEGALYSKDVSGTNLFWRKENNGTEVQLTGAILSATAGYTFLPGGILMQWDKLIAPASGSNTVTFPVAFSSPPYSIQLTQETNLSSDTVLALKVSYTTPPTSTTFKYVLQSNAVNKNIYWLAIGPA